MIVLRGEENTGKTRTMYCVHDKLVQNSSDPRDPYVKGEERKSLEKSSEDFECIIKYRKTKVALFSMGDYQDDLEEAIDRYKGECDIFVCTEKRPKGTLTKEERIQSYEKLHKKYNEYRHIVLDKTKEREGEEGNSIQHANQHDAGCIIWVIDRIIDELEEEKQS